jgi:hypothetical protein
VCALEGLSIHIYDESCFFKILRFFKKSLIFKTLGFDAKPRVFSQTLRFHRFLVPLVFVFLYTDIYIYNVCVYFMIVNPTIFQPLLMVNSPPFLVDLPSGLGFP